MCAAGAIPTFVQAFIAPVDSDPLAKVITFVVPIVLAVVTVALLTVPPRWRAAMCLVTPLVGVLAIVALDLSTHDASAAAQVFLCYPVLYAASRLRSDGAWLVVIAAVVGDAFVALPLEPLGRGLTDLVYVCITLAAMTGLLTRAGERQAVLVDTLSRQAAIDPLTGLVTRRVLDDATQAAISGGDGRRGAALILIDLDRFKEINDTYGHPIGDDALVHVAKVVASHARADAVVGRMGGDEIAVLLPGCPEAVATRRAQELGAAIRGAPLVLRNGTVIGLSASIGVAQARPDVDDLRELYAAADTALYRAKRAGRDQVAVALRSVG
jgi:diguanylate cyclase (GGDEF)-like protein